MRKEMSDYFKSTMITNRQTGVFHEDGTLEYNEQQIRIPSQFEYDLGEVVPCIGKAIGTGIILGLLV